MTTAQLLLTVGMMVLGTQITRVLPFLCFPGSRRIPTAVDYLGNVLPYAAIGLLLVYCLKDVTVTASPFGLPELLALLVLFLLHRLRHNTLLSIAGGTVVYMLLVQWVFA